MKPHSNFPAFHDSLIARLRSLSHLQQHFEKRAKDIEGNFADQIA